MVTPLPVTVGLTSVAVDEVQLPPLATLEIEATDAYGRPYPGVEMVGYLRGSGTGSYSITIYATWNGSTSPLFSFATGMARASSSPWRSSFPRISRTGR